MGRLDSVFTVDLRPESTGKEQAIVRFQTAGNGGTHTSLNYLKNVAERTKYAEPEEAQVSLLFSFQIQRVTVPTSLQCDFIFDLSRFCPTGRSN